jgi:HEAT repeat protein
MNQKSSAPTLSEALAHLADPAQPLQLRELTALSDLGEEDRPQFNAAWALLPEERRRDVLARLKLISEDNVEYSFDYVNKHALTDPEPEVRRLAVEGLWEDEEPTLIRHLLRLLAEDESPIVREAAAAGLGRFAVLAECRKINPDHARIMAPALLKVANSQQEQLGVRRRALEAVSALSRPEVTQAIWAAYREEAAEMRASALNAMGRNCDLLWLPTIQGELENDSAELRFEAAQAAGELGELETVPQLIDLLGDHDAEVRLAAVVALGKIGGAEAKRALRNTLASKSQAMREAAEHALDEIALFEEPVSPVDLEP